ncbi:hypothetical protein BDY19DRAFT_891623 [Irpex rosettiformis]|uniref:Uncharacterized protein n=1 Tax=Irpex rosettiformis TaxID=378272 RepID=A0ACB8U2M4_9APHY|nr:hypothetical protein BDY19DRAFT_891623 [Irpex rosettiformis]
MAPRRPRSTSNVSSNPNIPRAPTSSPLLRKQIAVASDSIYHNNLTVLKRGDPTIVSIIDQFSHVCLYNYNGRTQKWAKEGYEGSMFVVEHVDDPIYGIYILNRMGTGDYIKRIYPEDDMEVFGKYLMYRYYPDFTEKRLAMHLPYPIPDYYRPAFDAEFAIDNSEPDDPDPNKKRKRQGNSITLGYWAFQQEAHEPLEDVMMRLRKYIKAGQRYPEEFRYIPGRPGRPPSRVNQALFQQQNGGRWTFANSLYRPNLESQIGPSNVQSARTLPSSQPSELDMLFAKLQPSQPPPPSIAAHEPQPTPSRSVESWFAALSGQEAALPNTTGPPPAASLGSVAAQMGPATSSRGLALLDSIFASASQGNVPYSAHSMPQIPPRLPPQPEEIQIVSPKPQSSTLPQILNQNVISALLGLSPGSGDSRSSSAALSSNSSQRSGAKRYEGDNELSESEIASDGGLSASSTVLETIVDPAILARGSPHGIPSFSYPEQSMDSTYHAPVSVQGDVTPRAGLRGIGPGSPLLTSQSGQPFLVPPGVNANDSSQVATNGQGSVSPGRPGSRGGRSLVPFSTDHELWPYPRPPLNDNDASDGDIVELDFSDTRALSNPSIFKEKQTKQGKGERRRKGKKEKAADRERERAAIEDGWDDPTKGQVTLRASTTASSVASAQGGPSSSTATVTGAVVPNGKGKGVVNGNVPTNGVNGTTTADAARSALLVTLATQPKGPPRDLSRKQFVQEVLSLIYSDNSFVDRLYQEYSSPTHS